MLRVNVKQAMLSPITVYVTLVILYFFFLHDRFILQYKKEMEKLQNESLEDLGIISPLSFKYSKNPGHLCTGVNDESKLTLLVLVCSPISNAKERIVIRRTWASIASKDNGMSSTRVGFILGATSNFDLQKKIREESLVERDIIQLDFIDSRQNLNIRPIMLLKWVTEYCPDVDYVLKTDYDTYVNVPNLIISLKGLSVVSNGMYGRQLFQKSKSVRDLSYMWNIPKKHYQENVIHYLTGPAYVMSRDIVPKLLKLSVKIPLLSLENVYVARLCASRRHVTISNRDDFSNRRRPRTGCACKKSLIGKHVTIREITLIWERQQKYSNMLAIRFSKRNYNAKITLNE